MPKKVRVKRRVWRHPHEDYGTSCLAKARYKTETEALDSGMWKAYPCAYCGHFHRASVYKEPKNPNTQRYMGNR
jgi:hypothetical protein